MREPAAGAPRGQDHAEADARQARLLAAARAYWRLWRRNWRAPFSPGDAPSAGRTGRRPEDRP